MSDRDFPRRTGVATLVAREGLTRRMIRVTLSGDGFGADWPVQQPGEIVTLLFTPPGHPIVLPVRGWSFPPGTEDQPWRNYTVRRHRPAAGEIDVDVVLHEPRGPACTWAARAELGSPVGYAGPRVDFALREGARWLLLCGDETAVPAISAILETPQPVERVLAVMEVHDRGEMLRLDLPPGPEVAWVHRDGAAAATTVHLADALRVAELPDGPGQVWGAAESTVARDVRAVLRGERGLPAEHVRATGYWSLVGPRARRSA